MKIKLHLDQTTISFYYVDLVIVLIAPYCTTAILHLVFDPLSKIEVYSWAQYPSLPSKHKRTWNSEYNTEISWQHQLTFRWSLWNSTISLCDSHSMTKVLGHKRKHSTSPSNLTLCNNSTSSWDKLMCNNMSYPKSPWFWWSLIPFNRCKHIPPHGENSNSVMLNRLLKFTKRWRR